MKLSLDDGRALICEWGLYAALRGERADDVFRAAIEYVAGAAIRLGIPPEKVDGALNALWALGDEKILAISAAWSSVKAPERSAQRTFSGPRLLTPKLLSETSPTDEAMAEAVIEGLSETTHGDADNRECHGRYRVTEYSFGDLVPAPRPEDHTDRAWECKRCGSITFDSGL